MYASFTILNGYFFFGHPMQNPKISSQLANLAACSSSLCTTHPTRCCSCVMSTIRLTLFVNMLHNYTYVNYMDTREHMNEWWGEGKHIHNYPTEPSSIYNQIVTWLSGIVELLRRINFKHEVQMFQSEHLHCSGITRTVVTQDYTGNSDMIS